MQAMLDLGDRDDRHYWALLKPRVETSNNSPEDTASLATIPTEDLARLWNLDAQVLGALQAAGGATVDAMSTAGKLAAAVALVSAWAAEPARAEGRTPARVLELLSSAMLDVEGAQPGMSSEDRKEAPALPNAAQLRVEMGLPPLELAKEAAVDPSNTPRSASGAEEPTPDVARKLRAVMADNVRLATALATPPGLLSREAAPAAMEEDSPPSGPCYIDKLPAELLGMILADAYVAMLVPPTNGDEPTAPHRLSPIERRKAAASSFVMACARVSKRWIEPATSVGYRHILIRNGHALVALNARLGSPGGAAHAAQIVDIDIVVPALGTSNDTAGTVYRPMMPARLRTTARRGTGFRSLVGNRTPPPEPKPPVVDGEEVSAVDEFAKLVTHATCLRGLTLKVVASPKLSTILSTLSSLRQLTSLTVVSVIDYEDLEQIMNNIPTLEELSLVDVSDISNTPVSTTPHSATRLRVFDLGPGAGGGFYPSAITSEQLCWLVEPAATAGALRDVQIATVATRGGGQGIGWGGGGGHSVPYTSASFVDLLVRAGPGLESLALRDLEAGAGIPPQVHPSLNNPPHDGSFDHLVSHLTSIKSLSLEWHFTSDAFLDVVSTLPSLSSLTLYGTPVAARSAAFLSALERNFSALKTLRLVGALTGGIDQRTGQPVRNDWTGATLRGIKQVAKGRGLECAFVREG
ncbi:hypothetical protein JCM10450v2_002280 [Rhodotorula kratochvilovae]